MSIQGPKLSRDELSEYYLYNKMCQSLKLHTLFTSILLVSVYLAYGLGYGSLNPCSFFQKDRVALFLGKILTLFIAIIF